MIRVLGTVFAGLLGLAFGSFLNVCLSRWPEGESIVTPRSHCRSCGRTLAWWENVPLVSWLALRGRCKGCGSWIGWRYVVVELAVGGLWAIVGERYLGTDLGSGMPSELLVRTLAAAIGHMFFYWLLVALAALDAEHLWLPNVLTLPGIALGFIYSAIPIPFDLYVYSVPWVHSAVLGTAIAALVATVIAGGLILLIRWIYWLVRRREGIGLGDAKLMAMLGAWLGLPGALLSFGIGVMLGALVGVVVLIRGRRDGESVALTKLPLGTFLCIGGIISALWGESMIGAYMRWAGF